MSIRQGNKVISAGTSLTQDLFDFKWSDHELNDIQWARADNFLWYNADTYEVAYNHLLEEWNTVGDNLTSETISGTTVYYRLAADGHKICPATQETAVNTIYNSTGVAWYYILDTDGQRFKLPRTKYGFSGLRDTVGKYIPESLPNIKGTAGGYIPNQYAGYSGAFTSDTTTPGSSHVFNPDSSDYNRMKFDASLSSSTYKNGAAVQERSTQMYLYFFVGNFSQEALVNIKGGPTTLTQKSITNCITEIPQDLKIELNNGTFTLKAGSKIYVPNGAGVFDEVVLSADQSLTPGHLLTSSNRMVVYKPNGSIDMLDIYLTYVYSGATAPTTFDGGGKAFWYDTTNNVIKKTTDSGSTWTDGFGFPIALVNITNGVGITAINQLFNGFGYIGSTVFALPNVKGLIPNGRNNDGTLKNTSFTSSSVTVHTPGYYQNDHKYSLIFNGILSKSYDNIVYNEAENRNYLDVSATALAFVDIGYMYFSGGKISQFFVKKQPFHAVDYNDFAKLETSKANTSLDNVSAGIDFVVESQLPTAQNNYTWYRKYKSGWVEQGGIGGNGSTTTPVNVDLPVPMMDESYSVMVCFNGSTSREQAISAYRTSTTRISLYHNANSNYMFWRVEGFAA